MKSDYFKENMEKSNRILKKLVTAIVVIGLLVVGIKVFSWKITERKNSPDKNFEVVLMDARFRVLFGDRNFQVRIKRLGWFTRYETIFVSPDENAFAQERFIWSKDNTKFLLVAKNLIIRSDNKENILLNTGEYLYFFYDLSTNQKWCNCNSLDNRFTFSDISNIEFEEVLQLSKKSF